MTHDKHETLVWQSPNPLPVSPRKRLSSPPPFPCVMNLQPHAVQAVVTQLSCGLCAKSKDHKTLSKGKSSGEELDQRMPAKGMSQEEESDKSATSMQGSDASNDEIKLNIEKEQGNSAQEN